MPLVFALYDMEIGLPCWSCEGHAGLDGNIHKLPQVWFYALDQAFPDLLANYLWQLHFNGHIENHWKVAVVAADNAVDTTYSIAPDGGTELGDLASLRRDIEVIGARMLDDVNALARKNIATIEGLWGQGPEPRGGK